jgi:hypothetical protein
MEMFRREHYVSMFSKIGLCVKDLKIFYLNFMFFRPMGLLDGVVWINYFTPLSMEHQFGFKL